MSYIIKIVIFLFAASFPLYASQHYRIYCSWFEMIVALLGIFLLIQRSLSKCILTFPT